MIKWFKTLRQIVKDWPELKRQVELANAKAGSAVNSANDARQYIKAKTTLHADVHARGGVPNYIITIGRYRNQDYIQCFGVIDEDFRHFIEQLREMQRYAQLTRVDAMPTFSASIKNEARDLFD